MTNPQETPQTNTVEQQTQRYAVRERRSAWLFGVILILVGVALLLPGRNLYLFENWWALFILIPAIGALGNAWRSYQQAGKQLDRSARSSLIGGLVLSLVAFTFLFELSWGLIGPILIILAGAGILLNGASSRS